MRSFWLASMSLTVWLGIAFSQAAADGDLSNDRNADRDADVVRAAADLLEDAVTVHRDGRHHMLLRALRHLKDPTLRPLFIATADSPHRVTRIHGMLGLAEISTPQQIDLDRLLAVDDETMQAEILSAALTSDLLSNEQAMVLVKSPRTHESLKMLAACPLIRDGLLTNTVFIQKASDSDNFARANLANMLLAQLGNRAAAARLIALADSTDRQRDAVREMLLTTALRYEFTRLAPWAIRVAREDQLPPRLERLSLTAAIRFGADGSGPLLQQQFDSAGSPGRTMRYAMTALQLSPWLQPATFAPLQASSNDLLVLIGDTGSAIAADRPASRDVLKLIHLTPAQTALQEWARDYAADLADDDDARIILVELIVSFDRRNDDDQARLLNTVVLAVQTLQNRYDDTAIESLRPLMMSPQTHPMLIRGIMLGLVKSTEGNPYRVIADAKPFDDRLSRNLALTLAARYEPRLTPDQMDQLRLLVRGGLQEDALRIQAAWSYLRLTGQTHRVLNAVLSS